MERYCVPRLTLGEMAIIDEMCYEKKEKHCENLRVWAILNAAQAVLDSQMIDSLVLHILSQE